MTEERKVRFRRLYEAERARIVAYVLRRTASPEDAADVVAETFTIAWQRLDDIPRDEGRILWLYVTARNVLANHDRRRARQSEIHQALTLGLRDPNYLVEAVEEESVIASRVLASLPERDRELLMLAAWEGLSSSQLAIALGCSIATARVRLHRARARLLSELDSLDAKRPEPLLELASATGSLNSAQEECDR